MKMEFSYLAPGQIEKRKKADALVLPFWKDKLKIHGAAAWPKNVVFNLAPVLETTDFKAKEGEILYLYVKGLPEKRICLLGLGPQEKATVESFRRSYGCLTKSCLHKKIKSLNLFMPAHEDMNDDLLKGMIEGLLLPNYHFHELKHREADEPPETLLEKATFLGSQKQVVKFAHKTQLICEAVNYARDLTNGSADQITPQYLVKCALEIAKKHSTIKTIILDKKKLEREKMGLLLAVNRGSALDPALIIMRYKGNPRTKQHTVIVGKGVTYDTGGLNLKQVFGGMDLMKTDMAGGAACFGIILAASRLKLKSNLTVVIPATENCIDAKSFKPGDVYTSYAGKTVEMTNADAEGRLILADALAYAIKNLHPTRLIDIATLTGAIEIALGSEAAGLMSTDDDLAHALFQSGKATFERLWRMPLYDEYKERLKSDIADCKNWNGRGAGANVAATFLRFFLDPAIPWAHLDIAGTAFSADAKKYLPKYATGFGVRLLVDFLEKLE